MVWTTRGKRLAGADSVSLAPDLALPRNGTVRPDLICSGSATSVDNNPRGRERAGDCAEENAQGVVAKNYLRAGLEQPAEFWIYTALRPCTTKARPEGGAPRTIVL